MQRPKRGGRYSEGTASVFFFFSEFVSTKGCQPYSIVPCGSGRGVCEDPDPDTPECTVTGCTNAEYANDYKADLHYGECNRVRIELFKPRKMIDNGLRGGTEL